MKNRILVLLVPILFIVGGLQAQQSALICPLGQGFWSTHPENWPAQSIMLGSQLYTRDEVLALVTAPGDDASTRLAAQLITAKLNVANGADTTAINATLAQADALLSQFNGKLPYAVQSASDVGQQMTNLGVILDAYNNATLTPNCLTPTATVAPTATPAGTSIVIEGPVQAININIITVSNINIQLDDDDPLLSTLQIGDIIRVEGIPTTTDNILVVVAVTVVIVVDLDATSTPVGTPQATPTVTPQGTPADDDDDDNDDDSGVIIVIEGPVQQINVNIITIYNIDILVAPDDPILTVIQIGDVIRVQGDRVEQGTTIVIVAVTIVFVNVDVVVIDGGNVWRDDNNCGNPPPSWAPANGWRRRCEGGGGNGNGRGRGNGNGNGRGNSDDDDD